MKNEIFCTFIMQKSRRWRFDMTPLTYCRSYTEIFSFFSLKYLRKLNNQTQKYTAYIPRRRRKTAKNLLSQLTRSFFYRLNHLQGLTFHIVIPSTGLTLLFDS